MAEGVAHSIEVVYIYQGHKGLGPYSENVIKQTNMFRDLNKYRAQKGKLQWKVEVVCGEDLISTLEKCDHQKTLLVFPAGQSSHYDKAFSSWEVEYIQTFVSKGGGRVYGTCGAAYWLTETREYDGLCTTNPKKREVVVKKSPLPLFNGVAKGPLCPFPGAEYQVGFYSDAVTVKADSSDCTIYLSGGGSFFIDEESSQRVQVVARYRLEELRRLKPDQVDLSLLEKAALLVRVGEGGALLAMFHPYYGPKDIDVARYEEAFPEVKSGTNWKRVHARLSKLDERIAFFNLLIEKLDRMQVE